MYIYFILFVGIISYILDINLNKNFKGCKKKLSVNILLLLHHILFAFVILGLLSNNIKVVKIYACTVGVIFLSWFVYNLDCILTYFTNFCGKLPLDEPFVPFYTYINEMCTGKKVDVAKIRVIGDYIFMFVAICLALLKIGNLTKNKSYLK